MINEISPKRAGNAGVEPVLSQTPQSKAQAESAKFTQAQSVVKKEETFFSPVVKIDTQTHAAILVFRDTETGEVEREFPNKPQGGAYATAPAPQQAIVPQPATETVDKPEAKVEVEVEVEGEGEVEPEAKA